MAALGAEFKPGTGYVFINDKAFMRITMTDGAHVGGPSHGLQ